MNVKRVRHGKRAKAFLVMNRTPFVCGTGKNNAILRNQLAARNHANQSTMRVSDMAAGDLHVRNPIMSF